MLSGQLLPLEMINRKAQFRFKKQIINRKYPVSILDYLQPIEDIPNPYRGERGQIRDCTFDVRCMTKATVYKPELRWLRYQSIHQPLPRLRNDVTLYSPSYVHMLLNMDGTSTYIRDKHLLVCQTILRDFIISADIDFACYFRFLGSLYLDNCSYLEFWRTPVSNYAIVWTIPYSDNAERNRASHIYAHGYGLNDALAVDTTKQHNKIGFKSKRKDVQRPSLDVSSTIVEPPIGADSKAALAYASRVISAVYGLRRKSTTVVVDCPPAMVNVVASELIAADLTPVFYNGELTPLHMPMKELSQLGSAIKPVTLGEFSSYAIGAGQSMVMAYHTKEHRDAAFKRAKAATGKMSRWGLTYRLSKLQMTDEEKSTTNADKYGYPQFFIRLERLT